jgi:hypothetical protein
MEDQGSGLVDQVGDVGCRDRVDSEPALAGALVVPTVVWVTLPQKCE